MDKTYVFDSGANSQNGLLASILPALQNRGVDTGYLMGMLNNGNNGGLFGGRGFEDIIALIIVAAIFGNGNFGFGGGFGGGNGANIATGTAERELLSSMIQRNGIDLNNLASTLHCSLGDIQTAIGSVTTQICNLAASNGQSFQQVINAIQQGNCTLSAQLASCCCDLKTAVERQGYENRLSTLAQTDSIKEDANSKFNIITSKIDAQSQIIQNGFCDLEKRELNREINQLRDERSALQNSALLQQQSQNLINQLRPCPQPAFLVCNPYGTTYGSPFGYNGAGYGYYNNGCGSCNSCGC